MNEGLPSMSIRCIYKDSGGLLWIGTDAGLCSFDGKSFRIYKSNEGMTASKIWTIAEDEDHNLWFGSYGNGLYKYDGIHFQQFTKKNGLVSNYIRVLLYSKKFHCLIVGAEYGVNTIKGSTITSSPSEMFTTKVGRTVTGLCEAGIFIYITTYGDNNPVKYYPDQNKFIVSNDNGKHYPQNSFSCYVSANGDTIFSNKANGIKIFKKNKQIIQNDNLGQIFSCAEDKRGNLWIAAWSYQNMNQSGGLFRFDGERFQNFKTTFGISDREIWTVSYDREQDILWVGTTNEGLFKISFIDISYYPPDYFHLESQKINNLLVDNKNSLWISGSKELIKMIDDKSFSFLNKRPMIAAYQKFWNNPLQKIQPPMGETMKAAKDVHPSKLSIFEKQTNFNFNKVINDTNHSVIYSSELGLFRYNRTTGETDYLGQEGALGEFASINDSLVVSVWGPTALNPSYKSSRLNYDNSTFFPTQLFLQFTKDGDPKDVTRIAKHGEQIWYSTSNTGLWMSQGMNLISFNKIDSTINQNLNDVCFDEFGHVIFGSNNGEICIGTYENQKLKINYRINGENGLEGNSIFWLVADNKGKLWVGTNRGLNSIDLKKLFTTGELFTCFFDEEDGYYGQMSKHAVIDTKGNLWVGAGSNLIKVDIERLLENNSETNEVILRNIEINQQPIGNFADKLGLNNWTLLPEKGFNFKRTENNITFEFDVLNYRNPSKDKFRYKLEGFDKEWSNWSENRRAVYTNLLPGNYHLEVESMNTNMNFKALPLAFVLRVRPYWWEIWYIRLIALSCWIGLIIYVIRKYFELKRIRQQKRLEIEKTIVSLEMQALQAQMNPHFIFNCVNGIQYYVLANKMDLVLAYLSDFSKVIRESLANANQKMIPLNQEMDFLKSYLRLEQMRFPDRFEYKIQCEEENAISFVQIPPMLVQPFIENAIRHGFSNLKGNGHLFVLFQQEANDVLKCTITDNGTGRNNSKQKLNELQDDRLHSGQITESRIRLFNTPDSPEKYKIVYTDLFYMDEPCGLKVEIYFPAGITSS